LTNIQGYQNTDADLTVITDSKSMSQIIGQQATYKSLAKSGKLSFEGDAAVLLKLQSIIARFDPGFEIMPGTRGSN